LASIFSCNASTLGRGCCPPSPLRAPQDLANCLQPLHLVATSPLEPGRVSRQRPQPSPHRTGGLAANGVAAESEGHPSIHPSIHLREFLVGRGQQRRTVEALECQRLLGQPLAHTPCFQVRRAHVCNAAASRGSACGRFVCTHPIEFGKSFFSLFLGFLGGVYEVHEVGVIRRGVAPRNARRPRQRCVYFLRVSRRLREERAR
jgi:hypothetical protein